VFIFGRSTETLHSKRVSKIAVQQRLMQARWYILQQSILEIRERQLLHGVVVLWMSAGSKDQNMIDTLRCLPISSYYFFREYQKATKGSKTITRGAEKTVSCSRSHWSLMFPDTQHLAVFKTSKRPKCLACRTSSCRHVAHAPFPVHHFSISLYGCASSICRPALRKHPLIPH
jgi:hypothetical protein